MKSLFPFVFALMLFASCSKTAENNTAENANATTATTEQVNVSDLNQKFVAAWNNRNQDVLVEMLSENVHFLQGDVHLNGKNQVADNWVRKTTGTINNLRLSTVSSATTDEIAYEAGMFKVDVPSQKTGEPDAVGEGNYILLWKKQDDGKWKLSYAQLEDHPLRVK